MSGGLVAFLLPKQGGREMFRVSTQIKHKDLDTYKRLMNSFKGKESKSKEKDREIDLGDTPENLMKQNAFTRVGRRIRQTKWTR